MNATNNDIKHREACQLCAFMDSLATWERVEFITSVTQKAGVSRRTFYNWKYMCCRIPYKAKEIIENEAGKVIFVIPEPEHEEAV